MLGFEVPVASVYAAALLVIWFSFVGVRKLRERMARAQRDEAIECGLTEPVSLHPVIDPVRCRGCGACVTACPEQPEHRVLGLIDGRAHLINPSDCIGHGACKMACPFDAITLVFGSERRGVEIPLLNDHFETNVPGIYIAGELGGMGLIRNAIRQGVEAVENIARTATERAAETEFDVVIVGAGPAGFAASLAAMNLKLRYCTLEQDSLGGTVFHFPRGKVVMTQPAELPLVGRVKFREVSKEKLLEFWYDVEKRTGVRIRYGERVAAIEHLPGAFAVKTAKGVYRTRCVLLALGRRGTPRRLGVPGEDLPKVVYRLIDPQQYRGQKVLVVGGGDAALEAACSIAEEPGTAVVISYRGDAFNRAKQRNRKRVAQAVESGKLRVLLESNVKRILPEAVQIECRGRLLRVANDAVVVNAGGILPTGFLNEIGVQVETKYGTA